MAIPLRKGGIKGNNKTEIRIARPCGAHWDVGPPNAVVQGRGGRLLKPSDRPPPSTGCALHPLPPGQELRPRVHGWGVHPTKHETRDKVRPRRRGRCVYLRMEADAPAAYAWSDLRAEAAG